MEENKISMDDKGLKTISGGYELIEFPSGHKLIRYDSFDEFLSAVGIEDQKSSPEAKYAFDLQNSVINQLRDALKSVEGNDPYK